MDLVYGVVLERQTKPVQAQHGRRSLKQVIVEIRQDSLLGSTFSRKSWTEGTEANYVRMHVDQSGQDETAFSIDDSIRVDPVRKVPDLVKICN